MYIVLFVEYLVLLIIPKFLMLKPLSVSLASCHLHLCQKRDLNFRKIKNCKETSIDNPISNNPSENRSH